MIILSVHLYSVDLWKVIRTLSQRFFFFNGLQSVLNEAAQLSGFKKRMVTVPSVSVVWFDVGECVGGHSEEVSTLLAVDPIITEDLPLCYWDMLVISIMGCN